MTFIRRALFVLILLSFASAAFADGDDEPVPSKKNVFFSLEPKTGIAIGQARELVMYPSGYDNRSEYLSELLWDLKPAFLFGLAAELAIRNAGRYYLDVQTALPVATGHMEDFDWMYWNRSDYTHYSLHDISLKGSVILEVGGMWSLLKSKGWDFSFGLGYHLDYWSWDDALVKWQHSTFYTIYEYGVDSTELIDDNPVNQGNGQDSIHYQVAYHIFFGALQVGYERGLHSLNLTVGVGPVLAWAWDHHFTSAYYNDIGFGGPWLSTSLDYALSFGRHSSITLGAEFSWIFEMHGITHVYTESGIYTGTSDSAGFQYHLFKLMLGYRYTF